MGYEFKFQEKKMRQSGITPELLKRALGVSKLEKSGKRRAAPVHVAKEEKQQTQTIGEQTTNYVFEKFQVLEKQARMEGREIYWSHKGDLDNPHVIIYNSKEGSPKIRLNGKGKDKKGNLIVCRQLADRVAAGRMKEYSTDLSTVKGIEAQDRLKNNVHDTSKIRFRSAYYNLFSLNNFGLQLRTIAENVGEGEECSLLFESENHAMAISIRHKDNGTYVVKFYDPNATNMHFRALCRDLDAIATLSIDDFIGPERKKRYFPSSNSGILYSLESSESTILLIDESVSLKDKAVNFFVYNWRSDIEKSTGIVVALLVLGAVMLGAFLAAGAFSGAMPLIMMAFGGTPVYAVKLGVAYAFMVLSIIYAPIFVLLSEAARRDENKAKHALAIGLLEIELLMVSGIALLATNTITLAGSEFIAIATMMGISVLGLMSGALVLACGGKPVYRVNTQPVAGEGQPDEALSISCRSGIHDNQPVQCSANTGADLRHSDTDPPPPLPAAGTKQEVRCSPVATLASSLSKVFQRPQSASQPSTVAHRW